MLIVFVFIVMVLLPELGALLASYFFPSVFTATKPNTYQDVV